LVSKSLEDIGHAGGENVMEELMVDIDLPLCQTPAVKFVDHLLTPPTIHWRLGLLVAASPEIQPDFISVKWLSKKLIWCSR
jgi:hypothetical protein